MGLALSEEGARRVRVQGQLLDGRSTPRRSVAAVVSEIVGVQAQDLTAAELSIRARTRGLVRDDIYQALADTRSLVLTWSLRGTRHLHHADDVRWLLALAITTRGWRGEPPPFRTAAFWLRRASPASPYGRRSRAVTR